MLSSIFSSFIGAQNLISEAERSQRNELKTLGSDYLYLERTWELEGKAFPALVSQSETGSSIIFEFKTYKEYPSSSIPQIISRLRSQFAEITFLEMNGENIEVHFLPSTNIEIINQYFLTNGYYGFSQFN